MSRYYLISLLADRATDRPDKRQLLYKFSLKSFIKKKIFLSCFNGCVFFFFGASFTYLRSVQLHLHDYTFSESPCEADFLTNRNSNLDNSSPSYLNGRSSSGPCQRIAFYKASSVKWEFLISIWRTGERANERVCGLLLN